MIGEVRDLIRRWLVERKGVADEQSFYPYIAVSQKEGKKTRATRRRR